MKKLISIVFILTLALLVAPSRTHAAWWNPTSWFSREKSSEKQQQPQNDTANTDIEKQHSITPLDSAPSEAKTIEDLRAEIIVLKTNLDNLYKAHSGLVNDHNTLLKYTTDLEKRFSNSQKSTTVQSSSGGSDVLPRVATLERRIDALSNLIIDGDTSRIAKLEQRVNALSSISTSAGNSNTIDRKLDDLESTLNKLCSWTIGSSVLSGCPLFGPTFSIDQRLEKLERGY